jgi:hypothetical protein
VGEGKTAAGFGNPSQSLVPSLLSCPPRSKERRRSFRARQKGPAGQANDGTSRKRRANKVSGLCWAAFRSVRPGRARCELVLFLVGTWSCLLLLHDRIDFCETLCKISPENSCVRWGIQLPLFTIDSRSSTYQIRCVFCPSLCTSIHPHPAPRSRTELSHISLHLGPGPATGPTVI